MWDVREDSKVGCLEEKCLGFENYVVVDHGDGTRTGYHHLAQQGGLVEVGEQVCAGGLIGMCGSSGYSGAAHVHWTPNDLFDLSMPAAIAEAHATSGVVIPLRRYTSRNLRQNSCQSVSASALDRDGFIHQGVKLDVPLPSVFSRQSQPLVTIRGRYFGQEPRVALSLKSRESSGGWETRCVKQDKEGRFAMVVPWEKKAPGFYHLMLSGATKACEPPGWQLSYLVRLDQSEALRTRSSITQVAEDQDSPEESSGGRTRERLRMPE